MIRFDFIEANKNDYRKQFLEAHPFPHIGIDGICEVDKLTDYTIHHNQIESSRTTVWHVNKDSPIKYLLSKIWVPAVKLKSLFSKSKTAKH